MGPTASGKTALAIELSKAFPFEMISVDSAMVYRGMDIGSAKPTAEELAIAPHHLLDIRDPSEPYSAADFCKDAKQAIEIILKKGKIPLLVGGTMLYFKALQSGLSVLPAADEVIRQQILDEASLLGWDKLYEKLSLVDPDSAKRIHPNDPQRLQRALEIYYMTGKPMSAFFEKTEKNHEFKFINIGLMPSDRTWLHQRIAQRFEQMLADHFLEEVKTLFARKDLHEDLPAIRSVGYRQAWQYLKGEITDLQLLEQGIAATRQLAKRQMTWLRHWPNTQLFDCCQANLSLQVETFLNSQFPFLH